MYCSTSTMYAVLLMPDLDKDDMRFGQLLVLAAGLSIVVFGNLVSVLLSMNAG
jgi:hypothetical protein